MIRSTLVITLLYVICCAMAFGQSVPAEREGADAKKDARAPDEPRTRIHKEPIRGSLVDASKTYAASSLMAQAKKEPRKLKQHDLVTIIIREESQSSSKGTTDLQKSTDMDAKVFAVRCC